MAISHPYQGHWMEDAFLRFVSYASKEMTRQFLDETGVRVPEVRVINGQIIENSVDTEEFTQKFIDWCVVQYGPPSKLEG